MRQNLCDLQVTTELIAEELRAQWRIYRGGGPRAATLRPFWGAATGSSHWEHGAVCEEGRRREKRRKEREEEGRRLSFEYCLFDHCEKSGTNKGHCRLRLSTYIQYNVI